MMINHRNGPTLILIREFCFYHSWSYADHALILTKVLPCIELDANDVNIGIADELFP